VKKLILVYAAVVLILVLPANADITLRNIRFVDYPGFPTQHSTWKSIGYSSKYNKVFIGVTDHRGQIGLYEFDVGADRMRLLGFIDEMANLRDYQWQGKIHSEIVEGPDGSMYFSSDGGESREEFLMNHPHGYDGGYFFRYDPASERLSVIGKGMRFESIKDLSVDEVSGLLYGVTYPQVHFIVYDWKRNDFRDLGRVGSDHVPRTVWSDRWGNGYYVDWRMRLVKWERETDQLLFDSESLPRFPETTGQMIVTGVPTYAKDHEKGIIYLITYGNMICSFEPRERGFGPVKALGPTWETEKKPPPGYVPNSAFADNGKLYYFAGGHGNYVVPETTLLVEFEPATQQKRIVLQFPTSRVSEATGADVKDREGNLYFAGRKRDARAADMGESGASRPFLIIFNPQKKLR
jgi:hypothetical protein